MYFSRKSQRYIFFKRERVLSISVITSSIIYFIGSSQYFFFNILKVATWLIFKIHFVLDSSRFFPRKIHYFNLEEKEEKRLYPLQFFLLTPFSLAELHDTIGSAPEAAKLIGCDYGCQFYRQFLPKYTTGDGC